MKRASAVLGLMALPMLAAASDNTITFVGEVADNTCQISVNGNAANPVVLLPTVSIGDLAAAGDTAGETSFTVALEGCDTTSAGTAVKTVFVPNGLQGQNLANQDDTASGGAANVSLQLLDAPGGAPVSLVNGVNEVDGLTIASDGSANHDFAVRYYADGKAGAGSVSAAVQYAISYQ
jgi:major type 1 subunit fimbrin (pilin)